MPLLISTNQNPKYGTAVNKLTISNAGTGYTAYDVLTINSGDTNATIEVLTVDGGGAILTFDRLEVGSGYSAGTYGVTGGTGVNAQFTITVKQGIGTKNGFYKAEEYLLGDSSSGGTSTGLTAWATQAMNFQRASNISGVQLFFSTGKTTNGVKHYPIATSIQRADVCTISIASPGVVTLVSHGLSAGDALGFTTTGALPSGLAIATVYFVHTVLTADTFTVKATWTGNQINTSGSQSGVQTLWSDRAVKIESGDDILHTGYMAYHVPKHTFKFSTPVATTTAANKWRLAVRAHNDGLFTYSNVHLLYTPASAASGFYRVVYGDNQASYRDTEKAAYVTAGTPATITAHNHGLAVNDVVKFLQSDGALPTGFASNTAYYVIATGLTKSTFQLSASLGGGAINATGTHTGSARLMTKTVTISIASPGVVTWVGHGLEVGDVVAFTTTGALPTGITGETVASAISGGTNYFVTSVPTTDTFQFSTTLGGTPVNTSGTQSGVHHIILANPLVTVDETFIDRDCYFRGIRCASDTNLGSIVVGKSKYDNETQGSTLRWENNPLRSYRVTNSGGTSVGSCSNIETGRWLKNTTITIASPAVLTYANHGLEEGQLVSFTRNETETTSTTTDLNIRTEELPTGLVFDKHYYVKLIDANTFKLSATVGGADINTSGTQVGTHHLNAPIPFAKQAQYFIAVMPDQLNTSSYSGVRVGYIVGLNNPSGFFFNGEYPEHMYTTLASQVNVGATTINVDDDLSSEWGVGDLIGIGKWDTTGQGRPPYTITSISGTTIGISPAVAATYTALAGGHVVNISRRGIKMTGSYANILYTWQHSGPNHMLIRGVYSRYIQMSGAGYDTNYDPISIRTNVEVDHCGLEQGTATTSNQFIISYIPHPVATYIHDNVTCQSAILYAFGQAPLSYPTGNIQSTGRYISLKRNIITNTYNSELHNNLLLNLMIKADVQDNIFESKYYSTLHSIALYGINCIFKNNKFWGVGGSADYGTVHIGQLIDPVEISGNIFDKCINCYKIMPYVTRNVKIKNDIIGTEAAVTSYHSTGGGIDAIMDIQIEDPNVTAAIPTAQMSLSTAGSEIRVVNDVDVSGADSVYKTYGILTRTGTGRADTTCRTTGGNALRFESTSSTNRLVWSLNGGKGFTIGNCQNKSLNFVIWIKVNNLSYFSGTNEAPRIDINYDNGTHRYGYASSSTTDWQRMSVDFTPLTTYGSITIDVSTMTSATGTNAYIYFDDYDVQLPSGVQVNPGSMDAFANAYPSDGLATNVTEQGVSDAVWDDLLADHTVSGSFGTKLTKLKNASLLINGEIIV